MPFPSDRNWCPHCGVRYTGRWDVCINENCPHVQSQQRDKIKEQDKKLQQIQFRGEAPLDNSTKPTNPKDHVGIKKRPFSTVSAAVIGEIGVAMMEGGRKYGRHNYRVMGVLASVYYDATIRHLTAWWDYGQNIDPDSGLHHVTKAIASLCVIRDAMINDRFNDDRPPKVSEEHLEYLQNRVNEVFEKYPESVEPFTELNKNEQRKSR